MRIIVTGSHRAHEPQYSFDPGDWELFVASCNALGRELARMGHDLLLCWSEKNIDSQAGIKAGKMNHSDSHPFWETADYQALFGYLGAVDAKGRTGRVTILISKYGSNNRHGLFPDPAILAREKNIAEDQCAVTPIDTKKNEFVHSKLADRNIVHLNETRLPQGMLRSEILPELLSDCHAAIVLGGGKATSHFIRQAHVNRKLITITPACGRSSFSDIELRAFDCAGALKGCVKEIAALASGHLPRACEILVSWLPRIVDLNAFDLTKASCMISNSGSLAVDDQIDAIHAGLFARGKNSREISDALTLLYALSRICVSLYSIAYFDPNTKERPFHNFLAVQLRMNPEMRDHLYMQEEHSGSKIDLSFKKIPIEVKVIGPKSDLSPIELKRYEEQAACYGITSHRRISFLCILDLSPARATQRLPEDCFELKKSENGDPIIVVTFSGKFLAPSRSVL